MTGMEGGDPGADSSAHPRGAVVPPRAAPSGPLHALLARWPILCALATCGVLAVMLWPELTIGRADLNDHCYHFPIIARMADVIATGGNPIDTWISQWTLGYAVPRTYQPFGHLVTAVLHAVLLPRASLLTFFIWLRTLLLVLFPLTMYASARWFGLPRPLAAACAVVAPFVSTAGLYGLELGSYAWRGSGLYTQLWAMHLLPLALAACYRAMRTGRGTWLGALLLSLTFASHLVYGYIGALSVVVLALLPDDSVRLPRRLVRLAAIGVMSGLCSLWVLLPLVQDGKLINNSRWEDAWKFDSVGPMRVLELVFTGDLLDRDRLPVLSLLALVGLLVGLFRWRKADAHFERFVLAGSLLWLLLFAGRPLWGPLLPLIGLGHDVPLHRLIGGAHLFLMFAAGLGFWTMGTWLRRWMPAVAVAGLCVLVMLPVLHERRAWCALNRTWGVDNLAACEKERADIEGVLAACAAREGRAYPGLAGTWGRDIKVGSVPLYSFFSMGRVPTVAFLYHCMALTSDIMVRFDDRRPDHYRMFGITSVAATDAQALPPFLSERARFGRFRVLDAPGGGYFDCVGLEGVMACDRRSFHDVVWAWMQSAWPSRAQYIALDLGASPPPGLPRFEPGALLPDLAPVVHGAVLLESKQDEVYQARIVAFAPAWALFKMTYHPGWRIEVDGVPQPVVHVTPGFMAVKIEPGRHEVVCRFAPGNARLLLLLLLTPGVALLGFVAERVGIVATIERQADARARSPLPWLTRHPAVATAVVLGAMALPACLPLLKGQLTSGHDHYSYLPRLVEFHENVRHGILVPRWAPDLGSGHGQPLFVFAPPLLMIVAEAWHLLGLDVVWSINLALVVLILLSALTMYRFASFHLGREGGVLAATAYVWAPYFASDLYVRHAAAEFSAFAFYPLALDGISRLAAEPRRRHALTAAVGIAGVLLCHPPAALLFMPLAAAFAVFESARRRSLPVAAREAGAFALGLALSATAWLPALAERGDVKMERLLEGYLNYSNHFVHLRQLAWSKWGFGLSVLGPGDTMSFTFGLVHLVLAVVAVALIVRRRLPVMQVALFFVAATIGYAWLVSTLSKPLWDRVQLLQFVEFPWRALAPAAVGIALLVGALAPACGERRWIPRLALVVLVVANLLHAWPERYEPLDAKYWEPDELARRGAAVLTREEYEPRVVGQAQAWTPERAVLASGSGEVREISRGPESLQLHVDAHEPSTLEARIYGYPGWKARIDGHDAPVEVVPATGYMHVDVAAGSHDVTFTLTHTRAQIAALFLAGLALLACVGLAVPLRRRA